MKRVKGNVESKFTDNKPRHGGRKVFFHRLCCRIQRIPLPKQEKIEESPSKAPRSNSSPGSSGKKRKKSVVDSEEEPPTKKSSTLETSKSHDTNTEVNTDCESPSMNDISPIFQGSARLSRGDDPHWLSDACCFIRRELVEVFTASKEDVDGTNVTSPGQVGVRCVYCAQLPREARPKGHAYFPTSVAGIQDVVSDLQRR